jgi:hypothetical protein
VIPYVVTLTVCGTVFGVLAVLSYTCSLPSKLTGALRERLAGIASGTVAVFLLVLGVSLYLHDVIGVLP